jgi:hypothetical protein
VHQEVAVFCGADNANRPTGRPEHRRGSFWICLLKKAKGK